jgi:hypothetical protein
MALLIGEGYGPSTWGALRSVIFNGNLSGSPIDASGSHNIEYAHGFKTTAGNGFVRTDYGALYGNAGTPYYGPNFQATGITSTPPKSEFSSQYQTSSSGMLVNEDRAQLIGETAVLASGSRTITADAFVGPTYQVYAAYNASETITSIGKLTAF